MTGPTPVGRGKPGSKLEVLSDRAGILLFLDISAADTNGAKVLRPLVCVIRRCGRAGEDRVGADRRNLDLHLRVLGLPPPHAEAIQEESSAPRRYRSAHWPTTPTTRTTGCAGQFAL